MIGWVCSTGRIIHTGDNQKTQPVHMPLSPPHGLVLD